MKIEMFVIVNKITSKWVLRVRVKTQIYVNFLAKEKYKFTLSS